MIYLFYKPVLFCYLFAAFLPSKKVDEFHPIHVSTTDISYNMQDNKLEITCTIFMDDFELALTKQYHTKTDLQKPAMHAAMDDLVKNYLNTNLHIKTANVATSVNYLGFEVNKEVINVYVESDKVAAPKKVDVEVSLLHNLFDDQLNIVHITVNGVRKSGRLDYPTKTISQVF
jgi:hypothetical protein